MRGVSVGFRNTYFPGETLQKRDASRCPSKNHCYCQSPMRWAGEKLRQAACGTNSREPRSCPPCQGSCRTHDTTTPPNVTKIGRAHV